MKKKAGTLQDEIETGIRDWVLSGRYPLDAWLPSITELARHFHASDQTVKIALTRLKKSGLIKGVNGLGLQVCRRQKTVLLLSCRGVKPDWSNQSPDEGRLRAAVEGWHERILVLGREADDPVGPDLTRRADMIRSADVVVTYSIQNDDYHLRLAQFGRPVLALDFCPRRAAISSVSHASFQAAYTGARHLIDLGHRRIAFLGVYRPVTLQAPTRHVVDIPESDTELAVAGWRDALRDAGCDSPDTLVARDMTSPTPGCLLALVRQQPAPTALLCWQSRTHLDAREVLRKAGILVPRDLSLCQVVTRPFDTIHRFSGTAIEYDMEPVFSLGLRQLKQLLEVPETPPQMAQVVPLLRPGDSCRALTE